LLAQAFGGGAGHDALLLDVGGDGALDAVFAQVAERFAFPCFDLTAVGLEMDDALGWQVVDEVLECAACANLWELAVVADEHELRLSFGGEPLPM